MLKNEELLSIRGGAFSATLLNAVSRFVGAVLELGQIVGSTIRRIKDKNYCKLS